MRPRDVRAILFCAATSVAVFLICLIAIGDYLISLVVLAAYLAWILTRPRMVRVMRRLRGEPDWSNYFRDG